MAIPEPGCCDGPNELLRKILLGLTEISTAMGNPIQVDDEGVILTTEVISFNFVGAGVTATASGNDVTVTVPGATSTLQAGSQAVTNGLDTVSVVFPVAYAAIPVVVASISRPVAESLIQVNIDEASITVAGFTASLSGAVGSANYKLKWMANEP